MTRPRGKKQGPETNGPGETVRRRKAGPIGATGPTTHGTSPTAVRIARHLEKRLDHIRQQRGEPTE